MSKHHHSMREFDTNITQKFRNRGWWVKWISISGLASIAAMIAVFPIIRDCFAYGHDMIVMPATVAEVQRQVAILQQTNNDDKVWQARTDTRLQNIEMLINRVLDNQEHPSRRALPPKQQDNKGD